MSSWKKRLSFNLAANIYAQFVAVAYQLLTVPLFLTFWSKEMYGEWLVISALPGYIALSNMGLMSVAGNNMTMAMGADDHKTARECLHTVWGAQLGINSLVGVILWLLIINCDIVRFLKLAEIDSGSATAALLIMSLYAMMNLQMGVFSGIYRAVGLNARGVFIGSSIRLLSVIVMAAGLMLGVKNVVWLSVLLAVSYAAGAFFLFIDAFRIAPELRPGVRYFRVRRLWGDLKHGLSFMAYPLGFACTNQGMLLFVNTFLSSSAVVTLSTMRTVTNTAFQFSNLISLSSWPEFSRLYGERDKGAVRKLFCFSTGLGLWGGFLGALGLFLIGPYLLSWWTRGEVVVHRSLLLIFLVPIVLNSGWYTSASVFNATNRHRRVAICFFFSSILVPLVFFVVHLTSGAGLYAVGAGFLCMDLIMLIYVVPKAFSLIELDRVVWVRAVLGLPANLLAMLIRKFGARRREFS